MVLSARKAIPGLAFSLILGGVAVPHAARATDGSVAEAPRSHSVERAPVSGGAKDARLSLHSGGRVAHAPQQVRRTVAVRYRRLAVRSAADFSTALVVSDGVYRPASSDFAGWRQTGLASWYGGVRWQGRQTYNGERYDERALTAAHATLPMGTRVRVSLANSDRFVIVTINDRPGTRKRIIDLSRQAAAELGIIERGVATVTLEPL